METSKVLIIIIIPLISALIGWLTNFVAIKSLFRPNKRINFFGFRIQGVIPKRKKVLAVKIAEIVEEYLLDHKDIEQIFSNPKNKEKIKNRVLPIVKDRIVQKIPLMFKSIAEPLINKILDEEIDSIIEKLSKELADHAFENLDIKNIVKEKIENYDTNEMETIIYKIASKELKHIEYLGGLIGLIIGLTQVGLFVFLG
ncbi:MAG: DUF445 family protein [Candidatus Woesearchaeota archaeon]|jgi:uncharacterized membrane protein YheB (UPF0754 family)|nr:DUF445 family protein [Candidatus Woesearchaeota archaeon]